MTTQEECGMLWKMMAGALLGFLTFALVFFGAVWRTRRRRQQQKERPPQTANLLRPAGYSLQQRIEELNFKRDDTALQLMFCGALFGACIVGWLPVISGSFRRPSL